ncbi:DUF6233 domain-containing protein [Streptomyces sp. NPDC057445]|uniref:DUF6233 domain-containing protein n=1 Tax=Streptomyces sp. NPDC057445 TaxID=3346136 RepID=UPI0036A63A3D
MSDMTPAERLAKLRILESWLDWQLRDTRRKIGDLKLQASAQPARYVIEPQRSPTHPEPALIHLADCTMPQRDTLPISAADARLGLTKDSDSMAGCEFCAPQQQLGIGTR